MENSEQSLAVLEVSTFDFFSKTYELHITNRRMIFLLSKKKKSIVGAGAAGGLVGSIIVETMEASRSKKKENVDIGKTLDDLLKNDKKNFAVAFQDVIELQLLEYIMSYQFSFKTKDGIMDFSVGYSQFNQLCSLVKDIDLLNGKFKIFLGRQKK